MKHIILIIIAALTASTAFAAQTLFPEMKTEVPDLAKIRREVTDRTSPYYYPRLMEEFQRNDTVMKLDKYRRLYLGYMFQEDYDPYRQSYPVPSRVQSLYGRDNLSRAECDSVIRYAELSLGNNPLDLLQMQHMIKALNIKGNTNLARIWDYKLRYLLMAIESTGTGVDEDNAWYIVETQHEYVLLNQMGYLVKNHLFYEPSYEYIQVDDGDGQESGGFYFNIGPLLREYYRKHPEDME